MSDWKPMNVLVLGGDGFLGSHLVDRLVDMGHRVTVFDRFPYRTTRNLEHLREKIRLINGEFANRQDLTDSLDGQEIVFHFICTTNPAESWNDPLIEVEENIRPTLTFFEIAVRQGIKKIVFPSSGGTVYGPQDSAVDELSTPKPMSPYGIAKLTIEHFLQYFHSRYGISVDIYRIGNPFGPRQPVFRPQGVIAVWMHAILCGTPIHIYGDHTTLRDYIYVRDVAHLMTHSMHHLTSSDIYNLGTGQGTSVLQLLDIFNKVIDIPFDYQLHDRRPSDNASIVLNSSRLLNFYPGFKFHRLEDQIAETWTYFKTAFQTTCSA